MSRPHEGGEIMTDRKWDGPRRRRLSRRGFVRGAAAAGAATGIVSLAGCAPAGGGSNTAPATAPAANAPAAAPAATAAPQVKLGGAFRTAFQGDAPNLDAHMANTVTFQSLGPGVAYSKLVQYRTDVKPGQTVPTGDIAESWEQPDEQTYVFKLRKDAKFHNIAPVNGRAVVAQDVKLSFQRQIDLKLTAGRLPAIDKMDVVDPNTIRITAPKPDADFLISLAYTFNKIIPHESWELKGDLKEGPIIGSGPWIFEKWEANKISSSVKNPDYYVKGLPRVDRLDLLRVADTGTVFSAFRAKELDAITGAALTPQDADNLSKGQPDVVYESYKDPRGINYYVNATKPPFNDPRVRQAIFKAIDKQAIMDTVFAGKAWYFVGIRMPSDDAYLPEDEAKQLYKQDLNAAKQLLQQAGVSNLPELEIYALGYGTTYKDAAELIQSDLKKIGLSTRIKVSDTNPAWTGAVSGPNASGQFDIGVGAGLPVSANADLYYPYYSTSTQNVAKVKDPALDKLIDQQAGMVKDPEGRKKILLDIQRKIIDQAQTLYLVGIVSPSVRWKYVQNYHYAYNIEEPYMQLWLDK
jgi:peptide/nickel transport system substrate-binding protein